MSQLPQIETIRNSREAAFLRKLIADLDRTIAIIKADIETEEAQHRFRDRTGAKYPLLAHHLRVRHDNLETTVRNLTARLSSDYEAVVA
ncbi:hypothetical protein [Bradyrhizobium genosp. P]|uniref:hypothetical protein n=1 Tax=Bradyrhizobium genosp. P TaxID=83641 RepID=UPI003CF09B78